jgi:hypothetical protein
MMIREPVVAGQFYPASASTLEAEIRGFVDETAPKQDAIGVVSPHAGYIYSGPVAGATLSRIKFKDTFILLGPSHTGSGSPFGIMTEGSWRTPLGSVEVDSALAKNILAGSRHLEEDVVSHLYEHSLEVQVPILQYLGKAFRIVPIVLAPAPIAVYKEIGRAVSAAIREAKAEAVILASSDMTHYESQQSAASKDKAAIETILALDEDELVKRVEELNITMCGYAPTVALITAAKDLGARRAELVKYQTSGDVTGDYRRVVGYAGIIIAG